MNSRDFKEFFPTGHLANKVLAPLAATEMTDKFDVKVNVKGGGVKGQAEAISLGIARALVKVDEELKPLLKEKKLMTRDARVVERKKFGRKKAKKVSQFSKR